MEIIVRIIPISVFVMLLGIPLAYGSYGITENSAGFTGKMIIQAINDTGHFEEFIHVTPEKQTKIVTQVGDVCSHILDPLIKLNEIDRTALVSSYKECANNQIEVEFMNSTLHNTIQNLTQQKSDLKHQLKQQNDNFTQQLNHQTDNFTQQLNQQAKSSGRDTAIWSIGTMIGGIIGGSIIEAKTGRTKNWWTKRKHTKK